MKKLAAMLVIALVMMMILSVSGEHTAKAEFSWMTYQISPYTLIPGSSASLREILMAVGLSGEPSEVHKTGSGSNVALEGGNMDTWRIQAAAVPDEGTESLVISLNGTSYQIPIVISSEVKEDPLEYKDRDGVMQGWYGGYAVVKSDTSSLQSNGGFTGWWLVAENTTVLNRIRISGDVQLILKDGVTLVAKNGIQVPEGSKLTIYGQQIGSGALTAVTEEVKTDGAAGSGIWETGAGIGGDCSKNGVGNAGEIVICGGTIIATTEQPGCAGIGGGTRGSATIIITGGTVVGTGNGNGPGIGGLGDQTKVTITGGNVTGIGGSDGGEDISAWARQETNENGYDVIVVPVNPDPAPVNVDPVPVAADAAPAPAQHPVPKTGDSANPLLWLGLILLGLVGVAGALRLRRR